MRDMIWSALNKHRPYFGKSWYYLKKPLDRCIFKNKYKHDLINFSFIINPDFILRDVRTQYTYEYFKILTSTF